MCIISVKVITTFGSFFFNDLSYILQRKQPGYRTKWAINKRILTPHTHHRQGFFPLLSPYYSFRRIGGTMQHLDAAEKQKTPLIDGFNWRAYYEERSRSATITTRMYVVTSSSPLFFFSYPYPILFFVTNVLADSVPEIMGPPNLTLFFKEKMWTGQFSNPFLN